MRIRTLLLISLASILSLTVAYAGPVSAAIWYEFYWDSGTGSASSNVLALGCQSSPFCPINPPDNVVFSDDPPWTYIAGPLGAIFTITDVSEAGDSFDVFDFGSLILTTPTVPAEGHICGVSDTDYVDPAVCILDPELSHGQVFLDVGSHSLAIVARDAPFGDGVGDFRIEEIPEPATGLLAGVVVVGLAAMKRVRAGKIRLTGISFGHRREAADALCQTPPGSRPQHSAR
jgi:hypothetical protein